MKAAITMALLTALANTPANAAAQNDVLAGKWRIADVSITDQSSEWSKPSQLPATLEVGEETSRGTWKIVLTERSGFACHGYANELIEGAEITIFGCPFPYNSNSVFSPLHRIKLKSGRLEAVTLTAHQIYTWRAVPMRPNDPAKPKPHDIQAAGKH